jgi:hypothetical protein
LATIYDLTLVQYTDNKCTRKRTVGPPIELFVHGTHTASAGPSPTKSTSNEILLRNKYGGIKYYNCDCGFETRTIDKNQIHYSSRRGDQGVYITRMVDEPVEGEDKEEEWMVREDLHFMIRCYYKHNPTDPSVKIVTYSEYMEMGVAEDENDVDGWIANGGKFPQSHLHKRPPKASAKKRSEKRKQSSSSIAKSKSNRASSKNRKKPPSRNKSQAIQSDTSSKESERSGDESSDDEKMGAVQNRQVVELDDDDDSSSDSDTTVGRIMIMLQYQELVTGNIRNNINMLCAFHLDS